MASKINLSVIIIAKNEEKMIEDCLISVADFADEIIVVDNESEDETAAISKKYGAIVKVSTGSDYSKFRNDGLSSVHGKWILYVDADERVTPLLRAEIQQKINGGEEKIFVIPRKNVYLGKEMEYGGWGSDYVIRLFPKSALKSWHKPLHEEPIFEGETEKLENYLVHFSHRDLSSMLDKTLFFTNFEANLRFENNHPPVVAWRFVRVMATEFWKRFVKLQAANDGTEGIIDGMFQVFNSFVIYARLWELQRK